MIEAPTETRTETPAEGSIEPSVRAPMPSPIETLWVVGLGNIGSQVVPLLAALPGVRRVGLVDFDRYEARNLGRQRVAPADVGRPKVNVQRRVLRALAPGLEITAHACRFEELPLGWLRGGVIVSCVDSRVARQTINAAACALGCAWVDAALAREGHLRARAFLPGHACAECSWSAHDYALLAQRLPCDAAPAAAAPTDAAIEIGAVAAGLLVLLLRRLAAPAADRAALADTQWFYDLGSGRGWTARYAINPECRLDHERWDVVELGAGSLAMSAHDLLAHAGLPPADATLAAPGQVFVRRLRCPRCGTQRRVHHRASARTGPLTCSTCGSPLFAAAGDADEVLDARTTPAAVLHEPLARRGLRAGDIVELRAAGAKRHGQLA
jgi:ribosomal protein S27E